MVGLGANIHALEIYNQSMLALACKKGALEALTYLIEQGLDIHQGCDFERQPLHYAAEFGHVDLMELLLVLGVDINALSDENETPILDAAEYGKHEAVQFLLDHGANWQIRDDSGRNAYDMSILRKRPTVQAVFHAFIKENAPA